METLKTKLIRHWADDKQTTGTFLVLDEKGQPIFGSLSLERGNRNNERNVSRIPCGVYPLVWEKSPRFGRYLWEIKDVPNRSECKIHPANYWSQLNGCIALGLKLKDINADGYYDVTSSTKTVESFHSVLKNITKTTIQVVDEF